MSIAPSEYEQYLLELVNWARANPLAQANQLGIDLNANLPAGTISPGSKAPLIFDQNLIEAARWHSAWMLESNVFSHTGENNSSPGQRMDASGYLFQAPWGTGENIAWNGSTGMINPENAILTAHQGLFNSSGHRVNLMNEDFREVGLGALVGIYTDQGTDYQAMMVTQNFAYSGNNDTYLTGVVIDDQNGDGRYKVGEGLANVSIRATGLTGTFQTSTWDAGGYNLALPAGAYEVTFSYQGQEWTSQVTIGQENMKLDVLFEEMAGSDRVSFSGPRSDFSISLQPDETIIVQKPDTSTETLIHVERIQFDDGVLAFDIDSANLGFTYRIYAAAYGRTPDEDGLRFWVDVMDQIEATDPSAHKEAFLATQFLEAPEFIQLYGENPSDEAYIDAMYQNVLDRMPDQDGYDYWVEQMQAGLSRAGILIQFAESPENREQYRCRPFGGGVGLSLAIGRKPSVMSGH